MLDKKSNILFFLLKYKIHLKNVIIKTMKMNLIGIERVMI